MFCFYFVLLLKEEMTNNLRCFKTLYLHSITDYR